MGPDCRIWVPSKEGIFSVSSFFSAMIAASTTHSHRDFLWKSKVPTRVLAFAWLVLRGSIFSLDNLRCRKLIVVNACPLCLSVEESVDHLLLRCPMVNEIWNSLIQSFDLSWVLCSSIHNLFGGWKFVFGSHKRRLLWRASFFASTWAIWKERNLRCFQGKSFTLAIVISRSRLMAPSWVSILQ